MKIRLIVKMLLVLTICASPVAAQGIFDRVKEKVKSKTESKVETQTNTETYTHFARFEVRLNWKEKGETRYETRVYYSNMLELTAAQAQDREMKTNLILYFNAGVVKPLEDRGFGVNYYTSDVKIYPLSATYASRTEAEDDMKDRLDADKSNERPIYTFVWKYNEKPDGKVSTQPKKIS